MNNTPRLVDISSLAADLDRLAGFGGADAERFDALLGLVERLRAVVSVAGDARPADAGWAAVAFGGGAELDLYCSLLNSNNVVLRGTWSAGGLVSAWQSAGDRMWLIQVDADGELLKSVHTGPTAAEADLIAPDLPGDIDAFTSGMLDDLKGRVNEETRALIDAAMATAPGGRPNGHNGGT